MARSCHKRRMKFCAQTKLILFLPLFPNGTAMQERFGIYKVPSGSLSDVGSISINRGGWCQAPTGRDIVARGWSEVQTKPRDYPEWTEAPQRGATKARAETNPIVVPRWGTSSFAPQPGVALISLKRDSLHPGLSRPAGSRPLWGFLPTSTADRLLDPHIRNRAHSPSFLRNMSLAICGLA